MKVFRAIIQLQVCTCIQYCAILHVPMSKVLQHKIPHRQICTTDKLAQEDYQSSNSVPWGTSDAYSRHSSRLKAANSLISLVNILQLLGYPSFMGHPLCGHPHLFHQCIICCSSNIIVVIRAALSSMSCS